MTQSKLLVAQLGARKHYQEPTLFNKWGILDTLYTDFYAPKIPFARYLKGSNFASYFPQLVKKGLERYEPNLPANKVVHFPKLAYEYAYIRSKISQQKRPIISLKIAKEFGSKIIQQTEFNNIDRLYGFNGACLELFRVAKSKGIKCILDQTLAEKSLVNRLLIQEEERWSDWSIEPFQIDAANLELLEREQQEQQLADCIICGSDFVKQSLVDIGIDPHKISVVALGRQQIDSPSFVPIQTQDSKKGLNILFAGAVCLRKGIPYLLKALKSLKSQINFNCKVAGRLEIRPQCLEQYRDVADFLGLVPRSRMKELYQWADVFVLPSICEGSAMVTYEALCWGLPIITTPNSGSIVRDKIDGFIVPIRDSNAIANKLTEIAQDNQLKANFIERQEYLDKVNHTSQEILFKSVTNL